MLTSLLLILFDFRQLVDAQITGDFPSCAVACIVANPSSTCANLDVACFCSDPTYVSTIQSCLSTSCTTQDYYTSAVELLQVCQSSGVSISISLPSSLATISTTNSGVTATPPITSNTPGAVSPPIYTSSTSPTLSITSNTPGVATTPISSSSTSPISPAQTLTSTSQAPLPISTQSIQITPSSTLAQASTTSTLVTPPPHSNPSPSSSPPSPTPTSSPPTSSTSHHSLNSHSTSIATSTVLPSPVLATGGSQPSQQPTNSSGLSTGAYIGIGVGVGIGALLIIALVVLVFCLGKRKGRQEIASPTLRTSTRHSELGTDRGVTPTAEMPTGVTDIVYSPGMTEMRYGPGVADMGYSQTWKPVELPGDKTWHQHMYPR